MGKRMGIKEASRITGLSEWELRTKARAGIYPHMRIGGPRGRIIFDIDILEEHIKKIMLENVKEVDFIEYGILRKVDI